MHMHTHIHIHMHIHMHMRTYTSIYCIYILHIYIYIYTCIYIYIHIYIYIIHICIRCAEGIKLCTGRKFHLQRFAAVAPIGPLLGDLRSGEISGRVISDMTTKNEQLGRSNPYQAQ